MNYCLYCISVHYKFYKSQYRSTCSKSAVNKVIFNCRLHKTNVNKYQNSNKYLNELNICRSSTPNHYHSNTRQVTQACKEATLQCSREATPIYQNMTLFSNRDHILLLHVYTCVNSSITMGQYMVAMGQCMVSMGQYMVAMEPQHLYIDMKLLDMEYHTVLYKIIP